MNKQHYVYVVMDPRKPGKYQYGRYVFNYEPFYVGKGKGGRWKCAITSARTGVVYHKGNKKVYNRIQTISKAGLEPVVIRSRLKTQVNALRLENALVTTLGRKDLKTGPLLNLTAGGDRKGVKKNRSSSSLKTQGDNRAYWAKNNPKIIKAWRSKMDAWVKANPDKMKERNHKIACKSAQWAKDNPERVIDKSIKVSRTQGGSKILAYDYSTGKKVGSYLTQSRAAKALGLNSGNISQVLLGRNKQTGGYFFKRTK